jgi:formate hydrogenlyase subunit 3/multisubunit Na+/H+ antiporter MnhD subunit
VQVALVAAIVAGLAGFVAALVVPRAVRPAVTGVSVAATGALGAASGVAAMAGSTWSARLPWLLPLTGVELAVDALGGVFLAVGGAVAVAAGVYGIGYAPHGLDGRAVQAALPVFVVSLLLVPAAGSIGTLLVCWELMALASLLLVLAEHGRRAEVASAGRWYAVMTHLGFVAILIGLLVLAAAGDGSFAAVREATPSPTTAGLVFVLCLVGFGSKAGILPLHAGAAPAASRAEAAMISGIGT